MINYEFNCSQCGHSGTEEIDMPKKEWVGLTKEERDSITDEVIGWNSCVGWEYEYACAIEAKLKEKNT